MKHFRAFEMATVQIKLISKIIQASLPHSLTRFYPVVIKDTSTLTNLLFHVTNKAYEIILNDCFHYVSILV